jgi:predicted dehydrogenase
MIYQRDFEDRVRVGMVGVGMHAYRNILPALTFLPAELVGVADIDFGLAERTARQLGVRGYPSATAMYANESLDAVLLCVSPLLHPTLAVEAFQAGLHVWMEKPAAATVADVDMMITEQRGLVAVVGYKKAFMPATAKVSELIESNQLGAVRTILAVYPISIPHGGREYVDGKNTSAWLANGCHPLSFLVSVAGPVDSVTVHRGRDDSGVLVLRHVNGVLSNLHLALGAPPSQPFERYTVFGDERSVEVENSRRVRFQRGVPFGPATTTFAPPGFDEGAVCWEAQDSLSTLECRSDITQGLYDALAHFFWCVRAGQSPTKADLHFARHLAQLHQAAISSDGLPINVGDNDDVHRPRVTPPSSLPARGGAHGLGPP